MATARPNSERPKTERPKTERRKKSTVTIPTATADDSVRISDSDIALKAFAYYCERGGRDGSALDDWLRAERELKSAAPARQAVS
jgi:hypothetical protein